MPTSRRAFLLGVPAAAASAAVAGCIGELSGGDPDAGDGADGGEDNGDGEENDGEDSPEDGGGNTEGDDTEEDYPSTYGITVERVDEATLLEQFDVGRLDDQPSAVRDAVRAATEGGYETDSVDDALAAFAATREHVFVDGEYYALDAAFPQEVLVLESVDRSGIADDEIVGADTFRQDADAADAISTAASDGEVRRTRFSEFLRDLVDEYEYVTLTEPSDEDADVYEWSIGTDARDGPPYRLDAERVDPDAVFGDDVVAYESLSEAARDEVDRARGEGRITVDESPALLDEAQGPPRYVRIDGEVYSVAVDVSN